MHIGAAKQSYAADEAIFTTNTQKTWLVALAAALATLPLFAGDY